MSDLMLLFRIEPSKLRSDFLIISFDFIERASSIQSASIYKRIQLYLLLIRMDDTWFHHISGKLKHMRSWWSAKRTLHINLKKNSLESRSGSTLHLFNTNSMLLPWYISFSYKRIFVQAFSYSFFIFLFLENFFF